MTAFARESRATIRRRVGTLTQRLQWGTASAGAAGSFTAEFVKRFPDDAEPLVGGVAYIVSGTGVGQERVVTGTTQSTGVAEVSPNWTTTPDSTSVIEVWRDGTTPEQVNELLNLGILDAQEVVRVKVRRNPTAITSDYRRVTLPTTLVAVSGFLYETTTDNVFAEHKLAQSPGYLAEHPLSCALVGGDLLLDPPLTSDIALSDQWVVGYELPALLDDDADLDDVRSDYLTYFAAYQLDTGAAGGRDVDPQDHAGRAANWLANRAAIRAIMATPLDPDTQEVGP